MGRRKEERDRDKDRDKDKDKDREKNRDRDRDRNRDRDRDRRRERDVDNRKRRRSSEDGEMRKRKKDKKDKREKKERKRERRRSTVSSSEERFTIEWNKPKQQQPQQQQQQHRGKHRGRHRSRTPPRTCVIFVPELQRRAKYRICDILDTKGWVEGPPKSGYVKCPWFGARNESGKCKLDRDCPFVHVRRHASHLGFTKRKRPLTHYYPLVMGWDGKPAPRHPCEYQYGSCNFGEGCRWEMYHGWTCAQWLKKGGVCPRGGCGWVHEVVAEDGLWAEIDDPAFEAESECSSDTSPEEVANSLEVYYDEPTFPNHTHSLLMRNTPPTITHPDFQAMWRDIPGYHSSYLLLGNNTGIVNFYTHEDAAAALLETNGCNINVGFYGTEEHAEEAILQQQESMKKKQDKD